MICHLCLIVAEANRELFDAGEELEWDHPENCGCPCMHKDPEQWAKQFSTPPPWQENIDVKDIL